MRKEIKREKRMREDYFSSITGSVAAIALMIVLLYKKSTRTVKASSSSISLRFCRLCIPPNPFSKCVRMVFLTRGFDLLFFSGFVLGGCDVVADLLPIMCLLCARGI